MKFWVFNSFSSLEASSRASKYVIIIFLHLLVLYQKSQSLNILTADLCVITIWTDFPWSILYKIIWSFYFLLPVRTKQIMATLCLFTIQYVHNDFASYLKALQWIPKERMLSHPYIFQARNLNQNCFNHLGAKLLLVNRIWHPLPLAFCYHFKLDCLNKKTQINRQNKKKKKNQQQHKVNNNKK